MSPKRSDVVSAVEECSSDRIPAILDLEKSLDHSDQDLSNVRLPEICSRMVDLPKLDSSKFSALQM